MFGTQIVYGVAEVFTLKGLSQRTPRVDVELQGFGYNGVDDGHEIGPLPRQEFACPSASHPTNVSNQDPEVIGQLELWFVRLPQGQPLGNSLQCERDVLRAQQRANSGRSESHIKQRSGRYVVNSEAVRGVVSQQAVWIKAIEHGPGKTAVRVEVRSDQLMRAGSADEISNALIDLDGVGRLRHAMDYGPLRIGASLSRRKGASGRHCARAMAWVELYEQPATRTGL
jgi:hypothetical protein